jgi:hypothetical protein
LAVPVAVEGLVARTRAACVSRQRGSGPSDGLPVVSIRLAAVLPRTSGNVRRPIRGDPVHPPIADRCAIHRCPVHGWRSARCNARCIRGRDRPPCRRIDVIGPSRALGTPVSRIRGHARDAASAVGVPVGRMMRSTVMPPAHRLRPSPVTRAREAAPRRRRKVVIMGTRIVRRDASGATRRPMIPQPAGGEADRHDRALGPALDQPTTTYRSRGASLRAMGPSAPHTTMSSIRAPYSSTR